MTPLYEYERACEMFETIQKAKWFAQSQDDKLGVTFCEELLEKTRSELKSLNAIIKRSL